MESLEYLSKHNYCVDCIKKGLSVKAEVVDHIKPHKGNLTLFWDKSNWQALCKKHHDIKTATRDGGGWRQGGGL
jgi:5-methylcytosine-specific restriction protein A